MANGFEQIEHIVVLMLENRSFDHMLGLLHRENKEVEGLTGNEECPLDPDHPELGSRKIIIGSDQQDYITDIDPGHELENVNLQLFSRLTPEPGVKATNKGFILSYAWVCGTNGQPDFDKGRLIMRCMDPLKEVPVLSTLALNFTLCDHWFASVPSSTWPNRFFVHAATSKGHHITPALNEEALEGSIDFYDMETIYDNLDRAKKSWKIYHHGIPQALALKNLWNKLDNFRLFEDFLQDAASGNLPSYSFIEPSYISKPLLGFGGSDQHPPHDVRIGERLIANVYNAIRANEEMWRKSLLVVLYDEHGGYYDHVPPPSENIAPPDEISANAPDFKFERLGVRVPAILVSPWLPAKVDPQQYDHTSLLATVKKRFGLANFLTRRDAAASTFEGNFTLDKPRDNTPPKLVASEMGRWTSAMQPKDLTPHQISSMAIANYHTERLSGAAPKVMLKNE